MLKRVLSLALPNAAVYFVVVMGLAAEYLIVGRELGSAAIAALGLAGTLSLVIVLSFHAIEIAVQAIVARRFGEGDRAGAGAALDNGLILSLALGIPAAVLLGAGAPLLFRGAPTPEIADLATEYFRWRLPSIPPTVLVLTAIGFFNGIGRPKAVAAVYGSSLGLSVLLCWALAGGNLGLPRMGMAGAGLAHTLSSLAGVAVFALLVRRHGLSEFAPLRLRHHADRALLRRILGLSAPVFVQQFAGNFGFYLFALINAAVPDGGVSLAASTIVRQIGYFTYLPALGFGIAAATLVGQYLGRRQPKRAALAGWTCWAAGSALMVSAGIAFIAFRDRFVGLFIDTRTGGALDPARVAETARMLLVIVGVYQLLESLNTIVGKALQGAGETMSVMKTTLGFQWLFFLPLAWFLAIRCELGALGATWALGAQLSGTALVFMHRFRRGKWKRRTL